MTMRSVQDRFWSDGWVRKLNPLDRYLFLYLLTNEHTNWCGVYELDLGMMAFETGLDERELERSMLPRLAPKIEYVDGWVVVKNWVKHHLSESGTLSPSQKEGIRKALEKVPEHVRKHVEGIPYAYPMGGVSPSSSALSSSSIGASRVEYEEVKENPDGTERVKTPPKYPHSKEVFGWFPKPQKAWALNTVELKHAELLWERGEKQVRAALRVVAEHGDDSYCPVILKPSHLEQKWSNLIKFAGRKGLL